MQHKGGAEIETITPKSLAEKSGFLPGDILLSINGNPLNDSIDYMFYRNEPELYIVALRKGKKISVKISSEEGSDVGIVLKPFKIKRCNNNCIFCFVSQLPKGLRKTLYVKDEDYRMSFLYGNYVTLTNLSAQDRKRIAEQRLSPLYISVHSTNKAIRNTMLGNQKAGDILKEIKFLKDNKIRMHAQIVLCPGYNDGKELQKTIRDLYSFYPYVSSISVVPVGLTMHRKQILKPVESEDALKTIEMVDAFQKRFLKKHGDRIVYCSDELYIKAGASFPSVKDYGDLPQIENGVGLVPLFISQSKKIKILGNAFSKKRFLTFTGMSFYPYLKRFADRLFEREKVSIIVVPVKNAFFGETVTVTGLLTGRDVIRELADKINGSECIFIPDTVLRDGKDVFLDDISPKDIEQALNIKTKVIEATPKGFVRGMVECISEDKR